MAGGRWAGHVREKAAEALIGPLVAVFMAWVGVASRVPAHRLLSGHRRSERRLIGCAEVEVTAWAVGKRKIPLRP